MFRATDIKVFTHSCSPIAQTCYRTTEVFSPFCVSIQCFPYRCANCKCCYSVLSISTLYTKLKKRAMHLINYVTDKDNCEYDINDQETPRALGKVTWYCWDKNWSSSILFLWKGIPHENVHSWTQFISENNSHVSCQSTMYWNSWALQRPSRNPAYFSVIKTKHQKIISHSDNYTSQ